MVTNTEAVVFRNRDGKKLFGTLHTPPNSSRSRSRSRPTIVLLSPGVKMRVGPHRLYNRMTEAFNRLGFTVFKFDFVGLGDSEGELDRKLLAEVYNDTESGAFVNDGADALDWLQSNRGTHSFLLGGLCGGAITGVLLAKDDARVKGLISLGMTVTLAMGKAGRLKNVTQGELASLRKGYIRSLFRPSSWLRLLTFQSDFRTILKSVGQLFVTKKAKRSIDTRGDDAQKAKSNANPLFPPAFFGMTKEARKVLLIFSGSDRLFWEFEEKFAQPFAAELVEVEDAYELHIVKDANHVFSFREWEQEMLEICNSWLEANFLCASPTVVD